MPADVLRSSDAFLVSGPWQRMQLAWRMARTSSYVGARRCVVSARGSWRAEQQEHHQRQAAWSSAEMHRVPSLEELVALRPSAALHRPATLRRQLHVRTRGGDAPGSRGGIAESIVYHPISRSTCQQRCMLAECKTDRFPWASRAMQPAVGARWPLVSAPPATRLAWNAASVLRGAQTWRQGGVAGRERVGRCCGIAAAWEHQGLKNGSRCALPFCNVAGLAPPPTARPVNPTPPLGNRVVKWPRES